MSRIPTVNYTQLEEIAQQAYKGKQTPIELFPRWMAQTTLYNPANRDRNTTAYMIAGNSSLERKIGVAPDFPKKIFGLKEIATTADVVNLLGLTVGD